MITKWPIIEHFSTILILTHGSSIYIKIARLPFPIGSITGGQGQVALLLFFPTKKKNAGNTGTKTHPPSNLTQRKFSFFKLLTLPGFLAGNTNFITIYLIHFHYL